MTGFHCKRCGLFLEFCKGSAASFAGTDRYPWKYKCACLARYQISKGRIDRLCDGPELPPLPGWGDFPKVTRPKLPPLPAPKLPPLPQPKLPPLP